jgi:hypothetical protein
MTAKRLIFALLGAALLAGCAEESTGQPRMSYGPPRDLPGMTPGAGMRDFSGMSGWRATDEHYGASTPSFRGY